MEFSCLGCKWENKKDTSVPCFECARKCIDWYTPTAEEDFKLALEGNEDALQRLYENTIVFDIDREEEGKP